MKFLVYALAGAMTGFALINVIKSRLSNFLRRRSVGNSDFNSIGTWRYAISGGAKVRFGNIIIGSLLYIVLNS